MLAALDAIDWSRLSHAYAPATDVPDLVGALASADAQARERAAYELFALPGAEPRDELVRIVREDADEARAVGVLEELLF